MVMLRATWFGQVPHQSVNKDLLVALRVQVFSEGVIEGVLLGTFKGFKLYNTSK